MAEFTNTRDEAFAALRDVVDDLVRRERKPLIQGVKPALQTRTGGQFDEQALGFPSFAAFVDAAVAAGVITQRRGPGWRLLMPIGTNVAWPAGRPSIRHDLWKAFTDWSGQRRYAWEPESRTVHQASGDDVARLDSEERFVLIPPASEAQHVEWARHFLESYGGARTADALQTVLAGDTAPFEQFSVLVHSNPRLENEWKGERRRRVADAIRAWARDRNLDVDPYTLADLPAAESGEAETSEPDSSVVEADARLREAVKRAIDRMSVAELRELRLPVGALEGSGL